MQPHALTTLYPAVGTVIAEKYEVVSYLGEGGMGAVAKATNRLTGATVALKFIAPHILTAPGAVERFLNEAHAATRIKSAHVVTIFDVAKLPNGAPFMVMEFLEGRDLAALLETDGVASISVPRAVHFVLQILRALRVAHASGIIHRDLKPSNCFLVQEDGEDDFVKIVDFGISKVQQPGGGGLTQTNHALGTPLYMSPEQAKSPRDVDLRTDLYSVGVILYELLSGRTPYFSESGELTEILFKLFTAEPDPLATIRPDLPPELCEAVHRCIARERDARPATASDMAEVLAPFADTRSAHILRRLRAPQERGNVTAPMSAQASVEALAQLGTPSMPPPGLDLRYGNVPVTTQPPPMTSGSDAPVRHASMPASAEYRASPAEAAAATQMSGEVTPSRGPLATSTAPPKRSLIPIAIGAGTLGLVMLAVGVGVVVRNTGNVEKDPVVVTPLASGPPSATETSPTALTAVTAPEATTAPSETPPQVLTPVDAAAPPPQASHRPKPPPPTQEKPKGLAGAGTTLEK